MDIFRVHSDVSKRDATLVKYWMTKGFAQSCHVVLALNLVLLVIVWYVIK